MTTYKLTLTCEGRSLHEVEKAVRMLSIKPGKETIKTAGAELSAVMEEKCLE